MPLSIFIYIFFSFFYVYIIIFYFHVHIYDKRRRHIFFFMRPCVFCRTNADERRIDIKKFFLCFEKFLFLFWKLVPRGEHIFFAFFIKKKKRKLIISVFLRIVCVVWYDIHSNTHTPFGRSFLVRQFSWNLFNLYHYVFFMFSKDFH